MVDAGGVRSLVDLLQHTDAAVVAQAATTLAAITSGQQQHLSHLDAGNIIRSALQLLDGNSSTVEVKRSAAKLLNNFLVSDVQLQAALATVPNCLASMVAHLGPDKDVTVVATLAETLVGICGFASSTVCTQIVQAGAVQPLVGTLCMAGTEAAWEGATTLLSHLAIDEASAASIVAAAGVKAVLPLLGLADLAVAAAAAALFANLSMHDAAAVVIHVDASLLRPLALLLSCHEAAVCTQAACALRNFACEEVNKLVFDEGRAVGPLVAHMAAHRPVSSEHAALALLHLSTRGELKLAIAAAGALPHVIGIIHGTSSQDNGASSGSLAAQSPAAASATGSTSGADAYNSADGSVDLTTAAALLHSLSQHPKLRQKMADHGCISALLHLLADIEPENIFHACSAVNNLAQERAIVQVLVAYNGCVPLLVPCLGAASDELLQQQALSALERLVVQQAARDAVVMHDGLVHLARLVQLGPTNELAASAAAVISRCAAYGPAGEQLTRLGVAPHLLTFLSTEPGQEALGLQVLSGMQHLGAQPWFQDQFVACDATGHLVQLLQHTSRAVLAAVPYALIALGEAAVKAVAQDDKAVDRLWTLLANEAIDVATGACRVLESLAASDTTASRQVLRKGVLPTVVSLLHSKEDDLLQSALHVLCSFAACPEFHPECITSRAPLALVALLEHPNDSVLRSCMGALVQLAAGGEELQTVLIRAGVIDGATRLLRHQASEVVRASAELLRNLSKSPKWHLTFLDAGSAAALVQLLGQPDEEVAAKAAATVSNLSQTYDLVTEVRLSRRLSHRPACS